MRGESLLVEPSEKLTYLIFVILNLFQDPRIDGPFEPWIPDIVRNDEGFSESSILKNQKIHRTDHPFFFKEREQR